MPESRYTSLAANKRLEQLRRQVYGRVSENSEKLGNSESQIVRNSGLSGIQSPSESFRVDTTYLKQDLTKIAILSSLALGVQFLLYIALTRSLVKLPI